MLARLYQKSEPISFISLLFILLSFVIIRFVTPLPASINILFILQIFGLFLFFAFLVLLVNFVIEKNRLTPTNYYAVLLFVLLIGLFPSVISISKISLSHLFILLAIRRIYSLQTKKNLHFKLFDSGFYVGIAFLLYSQAIIFIFLIYMGYAIFIKIVDKNLLIPLIGFLTPLFIVFTYYYFIDDMYTFQTLIELNIGFKQIKISNSTFFIPFLLTLVILVYSLIKTGLNSLLFDGREKNNHKLVVSHIIISVLMLIACNLKIEESIQFFFFPAAVLAGKSFLFIKKNWIKDVLIYVFLILAFLLPLL